MKKKLLFMVGISTCCFALIIGSKVITSNFERFSKANGDGVTYVLNVNRSATASEISAGEMSVNTTGGAPILFGFDSDKATASNGIIALSSYGTFFNKTRITGLTKIEGTISSGQAILTYGIHPEVLSFGSARLDSANNNGEFTVDLSSPSDYFKFDCFGGSCVIEDLKFTYDCTNAYNFTYSTSGNSDFSEPIINPNLSYKRFTYYTTTTTTHEIALRCGDGNRATGKFNVTIGDGTNPSVSVGTAGTDWRIVDVGNGVYFVDIRIGAMGAGQKTDPAVNANFRTSGTAHANVAILDPYTFTSLDGSKDVATNSTISSNAISDVTTATEVIHFYTNTHTKFMFELRNSSSNRRTNKCTLTIGDGTNPVAGSLSAGWSISYVGNETWLVNIPVSKMGNANSGEIASFVFRATGSGGGPVNYADILVDIPAGDN